MTVQDFLNQIKLCYNHTYSDTDMITIINNVRLPKDVLNAICKKEILNITTFANVPSYNTGLDFQLFEKVTVDGVELKPVPNDDTDENYNGGLWYHKILNDILFIHPTPTENDKSILIYYFVDRPKYSATTETMDLMDEYLELLKLGVLIFITQAVGDDNNINYTNSFNALVDQYKTNRNVSNNTSNQIEDAMGWF